MRGETTGSDRSAAHPLTEIHELANVERLLRADDRSQETRVQLGGGGARITWDSWVHNSHARGSLTASVVNEIAATDAWGVATIHDPFRDGDMMQSMLTVVYDGHGVDRDG